MILRGIEEFELEPERCIMIGDKSSDMEAAKMASIGCRVYVGEIAGLDAGITGFSDIVFAEKIADILQACP
jgi:histidinol phosphatase-like enzyme